MDQELKRVDPHCTGIGGQEGIGYHRFFDADSRQIIVRRWDSPLGEMLLGSLGGAVCLCDWTSARQRVATDRRIRRVLNADYAEGTSLVIERLMEEVVEYLDGRRMAFDLPVQFAGTPFQHRVWEELTRIPYGATVSYGEVARRLRCPKAVRAVAGAIATNPISLLVPCHRVVGSDGKLTGYAGGMDAKRFLLQLEQTVARF